MISPQEPQTRRMIPFCAASLLLLITISSNTRAQILDGAVTITHPEPVASQPLRIQADLQQGEQVEQMFFLYRVFSRSEFTVMEMQLAGNTATVQVPAADVVSPYLEYYLVFTNRSGTLETYPPGESNDPFSNPPPATRQITVREAGTSGSIVILSPEAGSRIQPEELVVSVSFYRADSSITRKAARLFLDDRDVTSSAVLSGDLLVYVPGNEEATLDPGPHAVTARLYGKDGRAIESGSLHFTILGEDVVHGASPEFALKGSTQIESRREEVAGSALWYNRGGMQLQGTWKAWTMRSNLFFTSDEDWGRQPQNRYFIGIESPWVEAGYGDAYPQFPSLIMSGKRLRGFIGKIQLGPQSFMVATGETNRGIEGSLINSFPAESLAVEQLRDPGAPYAPIGAGSSTWGKFNFGVFERDLLVLRSETRTGKTWGFGFTALKGKEDQGSIRFGAAPKENLVVGVDFGGSFDEQRIELNGQAAFSAFNSDISSGTFSDEYIDSTYGSISQDVRDVKNILERFITINDNLRPLSLRQLSTLAYETSLGLRYLANSFKVTYLYRGSDFTSFGQTFLRKDIQGVTASDRFGLADNRIVISLGFERLQDNTSKFKAATTTFLNYDAAISYYARTKGPNFTVGYGRYSSNNGLRPIGPDSLTSLDDETNRIFVQSSHTFEWGSQHTASANISSSHRDDRSIRKLDFTNTSVSVSFITRHGIPLQTAFDFLFSFNSFPSGTGTGGQELNYTTVSLSGRYTVVAGKLDMDTRVSPTFGGYKRVAWDSGITVRILPRMSVQMRFSYFDNNVSVNDNVWALTYRYEL